MNKDRWWQSLAVLACCLGAAAPVARPPCCVVVRGAVVLESHVAVCLLWLGFGWALGLLLACCSLKDGWYFCVIFIVDEDRMSAGERVLCGQIVPHEEPVQASFDVSMLALVAWSKGQ
jgi:hypothetical protein